MGISHPAINTRDIALFLPFRKTLRTKSMIPLPTLVNRLMARSVGYVFEDPVRVLFVTKISVR
jgi:RNA exonuclease 4